MATITSSFPPVTYSFTGSNTGGLTYSSLHPDIVSIVDSSANGIIISNNGNARRTTAAYKFGSQSLYIGGSDYLNAGTNAVFAFGTGTFTCEAWVRFTSLPASGAIAGIIGTQTGLTTADSTCWWFGLYNISGVYYLRFGRHSISEYVQATWTPALNTWYNIVVQRNADNTMQIFIDGISQTLSTSGAVGAVNFTNSGPFYIGVIATPYYMNGYIDELRITKGVARYSSNFTPSTSAFPSNLADDSSFANVSLLLNMEGSINPVNYRTYLNSNFSKNIDTTNLKWAVDNSLNRLACNFINTSFLSPERSKFGSYGAYFSGSSLSYLLVQNLPALGSGNFTIEFWAYMNGLSGTQVVFDTRPANGAYHTIYFSGTSLRYYVNTADRIASATVAQNNTWYHVAIVRNGTTTTMYLNGTSQGSFNDTTTYLVSTNTYIGSSFDNAPANCYIDEFRITANTARYTANFTPPTGAFADSVTGDAAFNNVNLLLHMEPSSTGARAIDMLNRPNNVKPVYRRQSRVVGGA